MILVESLTVIKHQVHINNEGLKIQVPAMTVKKHQTNRFILGLNVWFCFQASTYWLLASLSLIVEKSIGFLITLRYPGTDLGSTGLMNGQASRWLSSSANRILMSSKRSVLFDSYAYALYVAKKIKEMQFGLKV